MNYTPESFIVAYLLTNAIELLPLHLLIKKPLNLKLRSLIITNSITLPIVWLVLPLFFNNYFFGFFLIEGFVIVAETYLLKILLKENLKNAFIVALTMNVPSAAIGLLL